MKTGQKVMTRGIADKIAENEQFAKEVTRSLGLFLAKDWGIISDQDKEVNNESVKMGEGSLMGAYMTCEGKIWIMTEHDRSVTTIMFPDEY